MEPLESWLITAPILLVGLFLLVLMSAIAAGAAVLRRRLARLVGYAKSGAEGYIVSGVLGLLALLTSFTFAIAVDRYDARRHLVLDEANAIGTAYLRAQLLPDPHRERLSDVLVRYADNRIALSRLRPGEEQVRQLTVNDALIAEMWSATAAAMPSIQTYDFSGEVVQAVNAVIDLDASRKTARGAHVPTRVFTALILYQLIGAGMMGWIIVSRNDWMAAGLLFILFIGVLMLMLDLDRPLDGGVRTPQRPMHDLRVFMDAAPFDNPRGSP